MESRRIVFVGSNEIIENIGLKVRLRRNVTGRPDTAFFQNDLRVSDLIYSLIFMFQTRHSNLRATTESDERNPSSVMMGFVYSPTREMIMIGIETID